MQYNVVRWCKLVYGAGGLVQGWHEQNEGEIAEGLTWDDGSTARFSVEQLIICKDSHQLLF